MNSNPRGRGGEGLIAVVAWQIGKLPRTVVIWRDGGKVGGAGGGVYMLMYMFDLAEVCRAVGRDVYR